MAHPAKSIANYFLEKGLSEGIGIDPMKLQKLVFHAHGWYLGYTDNPLIDELIQAWDYGPVIPSLYGEAKRYGNSNITSKITEFEFLPDGNFAYVEVKVPQEQDIINFLDSVWNAYKQFEGIQLSNMTHADNTPWDVTVKKIRGQLGFLPKNTVIDTEEIKKYFKVLVQKANQASP